MWSPSVLCLGDRERGPCQQDARLRGLHSTCSTCASREVRCQRRSTTPANTGSGPRGSRAHLDLDSRYERSASRTSAPRVGRRPSSAPAELQPAVPAHLFADVDLDDVRGHDAARRHARRRGARSRAAVRAAPLGHGLTPSPSAGGAGPIPTLRPRGLRSRWPLRAAATTPGRRTPCGDGVDPVAVGDQPRLVEVGRGASCPWPRTSGATHLLEVSLDRGPQRLARAVEELVGDVGLGEHPAEAEVPPVHLQAVGLVLSRRGTR